jgi:hypothetical protein
MATQKDFRIKNGLIVQNGNIITSDGSLNLVDQISGDTGQIIINNGQQGNSFMRMGMIGGGDANSFIRTDRTLEFHIGQSATSTTPSVSIDTSGNTTFAGTVTVNGTGASDFRGIDLVGTNPAVYFKDSDASTAWHIGQNGDNLWVLEDTNRSGGYNNIRASWDGTGYEQYDGNINIRVGSLTMGNSDTIVIDSSRNIIPYQIKGSGGDDTPAGEQFSNVIKAQGTNRTIYFDGANNSVSTWYGVGNNPYAAIDCTDGVLDIWVNDSGGTWTNVIDFNNAGANLAGQFSVAAATDNYLRVTGNGTYEAMTRYKNNTANYWYTGIRTTNGIASTLDYHIYSTALGDDAFALTTSGDLVAKRNLNTKTGNIQINGTDVIDSSRNLTNIGTISSGLIDSRRSGANIPTSGNSNLYLVDTRSLAADTGGSIVFSSYYQGTNAVSGGSYIKGYKENANSGDFGYGLKFGVRENGQASTGAVFTLNSSGNATFTGTITSGVMTATKDITADTIYFPLTVAGIDTGNTVNQTTASGIGIQFKLAGNDSAGDSLTGASIVARREMSGDSDSSTGLSFNVSQNNSTLDEALRLDHDTNATFAGDVSLTTGDLAVEGTIDVGNNYIIPNISGTVGQVLKVPSTGSTLIWSDDDVGAVTSISNNANNRILTATGGTTINGESGLTFDGATLGVVGDISLGDNKKIYLGTGNDTEIYFNGSNSYFIGTGNTFYTGSTSVNLTSGVSQGSQTYLTADYSNGVKLYHTGDIKAKSTATGFDVTGTVTADGLTVDGTIDVNTTSITGIAIDSTNNGSQISFESIVSSVPWNVGISGDTTEDFVVYQSGSGSGAIKLYTDGDTRLQIANNGDISFYEDTGTTAKLFWDASAERLGLGTTSPSEKLDFGGSGWLKVGKGAFNDGGAIFPYSTASAGSRSWAIQNDVNAYGDFCINQSTTQTGNVKSGASRVTRFAINASGKVGIGTDNPSVPLHIETLSTSGTGTPTEVLRLQVTEAPEISDLVAGDGTKLSFYVPEGNQTTQEGASIAALRESSSDVNAATSLAFYTAGDDSSVSRAMTINSSGSVGIGTDLPQELLHLNATTPVFRLEGGSRSYQQYVSGTNFIIRDVTATANRITLDASGNTTFAGELLLQDSLTKLSKADTSNRLKIQTNSGYTEIGAGNAGYSHFYTDRPRFYFSKRLVVDEGIISSYNEDLVLQRAQSTVATFTTTGATFAGTIDGGAITSTGISLFGKTVADNTTNGIRIDGTNDFVSIVRDGDLPLLLNRKTSDGILLELRKDNAVGGVIGIQEPQDNANELYIANGTTTGKVGLAFWDYINTARIAPCSGTGAYRDNAIDLGYSGARFDDIYATNGTIQTSDENEKQDIQALTDAEQRVATACKGLIRRFRWQDSVAEKDDNSDSDETARYHFGVIAQDLQDAFTAEGLDASDYGMFISSTWEDGDGVEQTRLGVRYNELLAFIITTI